MGDKPIIFSGPMVKALLAGRKTQTRRVLKPQPAAGHYLEFSALHESKAIFRNEHTGFRQDVPVRFRPGDRLWVKETWSHTGTGVWTIADARMASANGRRVYRADGSHEGPWWPSIFMPREFSRLTLIVTSVKAERLQDISEEDAEAEGIESEAWDQAVAYRNYLNDPGEWFCTWPDVFTDYDGYVDATEIQRRSFQSLWASINTKPGTRWDDNPWVAAYSFTVHRSNIDALEAAA